MGKAIKMERLKTANARQNTFSKRKSGIIKKARELSILCDVDVLLLMFSPAGKPTLYLGEYSDLSNVLRRFSVICPRERSRRKREMKRVLIKMFKKLGREIKTEESKQLSNASQRNQMYAQDLKNKLRLLQPLAAGATSRLSCWEAPEKVDSVVQIEEMEEYLMKSLQWLQSYKEQLISGSPNHQNQCRCQHGDYTSSILEL